MCDKQKGEEERIYEGGGKGGEKENKKESIINQ